MSTETSKLQYQKEVEVRVRSHRETCSIKQQRPKIKIKMKDAKKYKAIFYMNCLIGYRISGRIWLMKALPQGLRENPEQGSQDTSSSSHELPTGPRAKVEADSGTQCVYTHFPKDPNCDICLKTKITRASCRRRAGTVVPRAEIFDDLITADHKIPGEESESRNNHRYVVKVQDLTTPRRPRRVRRSSWSRQGNQKSFTLANSLEFGKACEDLSWNHCTLTPHRSEINGIAERAVCRLKAGTFAEMLQLCLDEKWRADSIGMLHLSAKRHRSIIWWEDALWKTFWTTI